MPAKTNQTLRVDPASAGLPSTVGLPETLLQNLAMQKQAASNQYNNGSFHARHPRIAAGLDALVGASTLNPFMIAGQPMIGARNEQRRKAGISQAYQDYQNNQLAQQKAIDELTMPRFATSDVNRRVNTEIDAGRINPNTPTLDANGIYDTDYLKSVMSGSMNPSSLGLMDSLINNQQGQSFDLPNQRRYFHPTGGLQDGQMQDEPAGGGRLAQTLFAGAQRGYKPIETQYDPNSLPTFISDQTFGNLQQAQTAAATNALTTGQNRYEFDEEAPKRAAEIQKALQEGNAAKALELLRSAQATTEQAKPALIKAQAGNQTAQANFNNRRYAGGPAPHAAPQPTATSELSRLHAAGAFGPPGSPEATARYIEALTRGGGYTTSEERTLDDKGHVIGSTTTRSPRGGGGGVGAKAPAPRVTYHFQSGRKAKL